MGELLATPWMVMAGVRVLTPRFICRTYMWIIVFSYWIWLMDKELQSHRGVPSSLIKTEPWQDDKKEDDLELRENRRRAKGVRPEVARLSPSEVLGVSTCKSRNGSRDILDSVICGLVPEESYTIIPKVELSEISSEVTGDEEEDGAEEENAKINEERRILAKKHSTLRGPAGASDCLLRQLANLLFKLTEHNHPRTHEHDAGTVISDIDILRHYCSISPDAASILTFHNEAALQCPKYPKPRYLLDYPGIFGKSPRGNLSAESSFQELDRLLFCHPSVDDNARNGRPRRKESTIFDEKATEND